MTFLPATKAAQAIRRIEEITGAVIPPIHLASTFARDAEYTPRQAYIYGRDGGPTVEHAEALIAELEEASASSLFVSGMAALVALLEALPLGAHVVAPRIMYHGGLNWLHRLQDKGRLEVTFFEQGNIESLRSALRPDQTGLVWIETPTNPNWDITDIAAAADAAHNAGALLMCDSTAAPPCTTQPLKLGADISFHSATKYLNGHSDITAGVLSIGEIGSFWDELKNIRNLQGSALQGFEAWLLIRGLRTLYLRYERASANALTIAKHFENHSKIDQVLYPGLQSHAGHIVASQQMTGGFGGMLSILVDGDGQIAHDVARFCKLFIPATSLGGVESLIEHRKAVEGPNSIVPDTLLRISVGIEEPSDLIADLEQAIERAG